MVRKTTAGVTCAATSGRGTNSLTISIKRLFPHRLVGEVTLRKVDISRWSCNHAKMIHNAMASAWISGMSTYRRSNEEISSSNAPPFTGCGHESCSGHSSGRP